MRIATGDRKEEGSRAKEEEEGSRGREGGFESCHSPRRPNYPGVCG